MQKEDLSGTCTTLTHLIWTPVTPSLPQHMWGHGGHAHGCPLLENRNLLAGAGTSQTSNSVANNQSLLTGNCYMPGPVWVGIAIMQKSVW